MSTFWITGASSGIGEALAQEFSRQGHQLILSARNTDKLQKVHAELAYPANAKILPFDLSDTNSSKKVCEMAISLFGQVDVLVLNAGLAQRSLVQETGLDVYRHLMELNYFGNVALTQAILPKFLEKNQGHFVVMSSLVGKFGTPFRSGYSASKHALHGFYDSLRAEMMMQKKNIDVTIICPGFVSTEISFNALGPDGNATHVYDHANANGITPKEFAQKAVKVIESKAFEKCIGGREVLGVKMKRFFPNIFAKKIAQAKVR